MSTYWESDEFRNIHDPIIQLDHDILGRKELARAILLRLKSYRVGALGIYGGWGTGKTSLLNLLCQLNKAEEPDSTQRDLHIEVIDAWKYESGDGLLIPIIVRFKKMIGNQDLSDSWKVITKRILATTALSVTDALLKKFTELDRKNIKENLEEVEIRDKYKDHTDLLAEWEQWSDEIEDTEEAFKKVVELALEKNHCRRIAICIDNLDRCSPENAVRLLESVKIFFSAPNCTWVFAMDSDVIASYINHKYEGTSVDGYSYLDKIIPEQYHISPSSLRRDKESLDQFVNSMASELPMGISFDWEKYAQIPRVLAPRRLLKTARKFAEFRTCVPASVPDDLIFALILLYHSWPDFYERLSSDSNQHIGGILMNFIGLRTEYQIQQPDQPWLSWDNFMLIPLHKRYTENSDLIYFLREAFLNNQVEPVEITQNLKLAIMGLRQIGLP